jgi:glycerol-3-phosphate acyltransferase PlsX
MAEQVRISIDVMGGDRGAPVSLAGAERRLAEEADIRFLLYGDAGVVEPLLATFPRLRANAEFHHCEVTVKMDEKPSQALRHGRWRSSMWRSIEAVKHGDADVAISGGNTGALMAMSRFCLRMLADIERPAMAALWPNATGINVVLDVGASIGADAHQLVDYAVMGSAMARALLSIERPKVGLINVGVEEVKGLEQVREAGRVLREWNSAHFEYAGFVEGDDLGKGTVDVFVTEGLSGNIALKTAEGTAKQIAAWLRTEMGRNILTKLAYVLGRGAFSALRARLDPRNFNGAVFLGLNGIVIKSHGGTDEIGFAQAIKVGEAMVRNELLKKISADMVRYTPQADLAKAGGM